MTEKRPVKDQSPGAPSKIEVKQVESQRDIALEMLRESQGYLSKLTFNLPGMAYRCQNDPQWTMVFIGQGCFELTGYRPDELIGNRDITYAELIHPDDRDAVWQEVQAAVAQQKPFRLLYRIRTTGGEERWVWEQGEEVVSPQGEQQMLAGFITDVTQWIQAEFRRGVAQEALRESQRRYRALFERSNDGVFILAWDGIILTVNQQGADILGYEIDELVGKNVKDTVVPQEHSNAQRKLDALLDGQSLPIYERTLQAKDGTPIPVEISVTVVYDDQDHPKYIQSIVRDVTARKRTEERLRESESRFRNIFENAPIGIYRTAPDGRIFMANPALLHMLSYTSVEELTQHDLESKRYHPAYLRSEFKEQIASEGQVKGWESTWVRKDGTTLFIRENARAVLDEDGEPLYYEGTVEDITERKRAEEALRRYAERLRVLHAIDGVILSTLSPKQTVQVALRHLLQIVSYQHASVMLFDLEANEGTLLAAHGSGKQRLRPGSRFSLEQVGNLAALQGGKVHVFEDSADFSTLPLVGQLMQAENLHAFVQIPLISQGQLIGCLNLGVESSDVFILEHVDIAREVADQIAMALHQAHLHADLKAERQRLETLIAHLPEGVLLLDNKRRILLANPIAKTYLTALAEVRSDETVTHLAGRPIEELLVPQPEGAWRELEIAGHEGRRVFEVVARPIQQDTGVEGWVLLMRDVTGMRQVQERIQQHERLAAVGQLAAGIAHDFNNIIASIVLYSNLSLRSEDLSSRDRERFEIVSKQGHRAAKLVQQILDFSRQSVMERHSLNLVSFLKELEKLLARTLPENIQLHLNYDRGECLINADPTRIQQAMMNLAVNARDAMPEGGELSFELACRQLQVDEQPPLPEMSPGEWIHLEVSDTGVGIPSEVLPHIFEPFFTTKERGEGAGLGLAQVYGIVGQHEGRIDVDSQVGRGTTFTIYLPALSRVEVKQEVPEGKSLMEGRGETILVVEDDFQAREAMVETLGLLRYKVLAAADGEAALTLLERYGAEIDLILSDLVMPKLGGVALHMQLKERYPQIKTIIISGYPLADGGKELLKQGITDWLAKPFSADELARKVREALEE